MRFFLEVDAPSSATAEFVRDTIEGLLIEEAPWLEVKVTVEPNSPPADIDQAALTAAHLAVEDELVEMRDAYMSVLGPANGLVIKNRDGSESSAMRMGTREALQIGITAYLAAVEKASQS
jgi:hypothetical protein